MMTRSAQILQAVHQDRERCNQLFAAQQNQIIYRTLVADTQTAVGAFIKLSENSTHHFLLESVEGGEVREPIFGYRAGT